MTTVVLMILFCSSFFSTVFDGLAGKTLITEMLVNLPGGKIAFLIASNIVIFILGVFLKFIEICLIAMPLLVPTAQQLGIDMLWLGVVMRINLQTAFISEGKTLLGKYSLKLEKPMGIVPRCTS